MYLLDAALFSTLPLGATWEARLRPLSEGTKEVLTHVLMNTAHPMNARSIEISRELIISANYRDRV
ncbi:hypothetical protein ACM41_12675 [Bradyrhizobium sp. CCBAU 21362]|nr:hypothetical protein [Bradyrhizobium sp. CCBAU 21362]